MKYQPHDYQRYAIGWILQHPVCGVFLDMGLGKTSITLTALQSLLFERFESRKVLVIAPLRVARDTWKAEAAKWDHLSDLRLSIAVGDAETRLRALQAEADIYIINRENLPWLVNESGLKWDFDTVVIDELSSFKNHTSKRYKALASRRKKITRIIGLTGTPSVNGLEDLWAEMRMLDMGERLGKHLGPFRETYEVPDKRSWTQIFSWKPRPGAVEAIREKIGGITISMKSVDHLKMPELISNVTPVQMDLNEWQQYDEFREDYVLRTKDDAEVTAANAAVLAGKLCQLANGAIYDDAHEIHAFHERKLDALEDLIEAMNGRPVLVAYWFRHDFRRIIGRLNRAGICWEALDTVKALDHWNDGKLPVGLIHPASAGHGLNLQYGGSHLIWFGLTWSLELYQQTNARLWRQGQNAGTVVIQHIVTQGTIDERILQALDKKEMTQSALIDAVKAEISGRA
ncbi:MAG: DEAD/DEAH box helicase [Clostridia bacterium]|nr:DEAD/DEAH box helicase [Clostridia bacterium]